MRDRSEFSDAARNAFSARHRCSELRVSGAHVNQRSLHRKDADICNGVQWQHDRHQFSRVSLDEWRISGTGMAVSLFYAIECYPSRTVGVILPENT